MRRPVRLGGRAYAYTYWSDPRVDELALAGQSVAPDGEESVAIYRADITGWSAHPHSSVTYQDLHLVGRD